MPSTPSILQAMVAWGLDGDEPAAGYAAPPESFLATQAAIDGAWRKRGGRREEPSSFELRALSVVGFSWGPSVALAVSILRRARGTRCALEAAKAVFDMAEELPEPVRLEAAYLFLLNHMPERARAVLEGRGPPLDPPSGRRPEGSAAGTEEASLGALRFADAGRLVPSTADRIFAEVQALSKLRPQYQLPIAMISPPPGTPWSAPTAPEVSLSLPRVGSLRQLGQPGGPTAEEAVATLRAVRGTAEGVRAIFNALEARAHGTLPEPVRAVCAEMLAELGDRDRAVAVLADVPVEPPAPVLPGIDVDTPVEEGEAAARAAEAARVLVTDTERLGVRERHARWSAVARASALTVEAFRALGGSPKREALRQAGRRLEEVGEPGRAAEVHALAGDGAEAERIGVPARTPPARGGAAILAEIAALDARGLRREAERVARVFLADHADAEVAACARGVMVRLLRGPRVTLSLDGVETRAALGEVVTIGRVGASLPLASPLVSRLHLRFRRESGVAVVEDLGSHNGTWLAGARLSGPIAVGAGLELAIGREIPLSIRGAGGALAIDLAGERWVLPLGPLAVGSARVAMAGQGEEAWVTLTVEDGAAAMLGGVPVEAAIELARGDVVRVVGATSSEVRVVG